MAAATIQIAAINSTDTQFRNWGQNVSSHFASAGWVQTGDSGQINWSTVTTPATAKKKQGYEIWRMADAFQNTSPVFIRIDYGSGFNNTNPGMWLTIGSGANGSGQLTGPLSDINFPDPSTGAAANQAIFAAANTANVQNCYFSGNTNYINTWLWTNKDAAATASIALGFSLERTKDSTGADTGQGVLFTAYANGQFYQTVWDCVLGQLYPHEVTHAILMPASGNGATGANVSVYPNFHAFGDVFLNPGLNVLGYFNADITVNTTVTVSVYGQNHTYIGTGNTAINGSQFRPGSSGGSSLLVRYE